jgi:hypothetical protein
MPDVVPGSMGVGGDEDADPLVGEFVALREAVAEQVRAVARLEVALGQVRGEVARKTGPETFKESLAVIRQDVAGLGERLGQQEAALGELPSAGEIGAAVRESAAGLEAGFTAVRQLARESTGSVRGVADEVRARLAENERALTRLVGQARVQGEQRQAVWAAALIGAVLGWLAWYPLAVVLPWGGGTWLVSTLIGGGRWVAGETLMRDASPTGWDRLVRVSNACVPERRTEECEAALAVHEVQPTGPAAPGQPMPVAPRGRTGQGR